ncbi:MAG: FHA domain-containing protein [Anaerolineae bacterium]|nr:FHA domain-containing protein [Anaerolineae bacterium]
MLPANVTLQYMREGTKQNIRLKVSLDATVRQVIDGLVRELQLPTTDADGEPCVYELTYQRQTLSDEARLFEVGVQENAILQLVAVNPNATRSGAALSANVLSRLGGKGSNEPLPINAQLVARNGRVFRLRHTRALIGRADAALGYPPESLDADLTPFDPDRTVSRPHALIVYSDGRFTIRDLYSQRGILVNGVRVPVNGAYPLNDGDWLHIGEIELQFRCQS